MAAVKKNKESASSGRLKKTASYVVEGLMAILLVLLFYSGFLFFMNALFPTGTSLKAIVTQQNSVDSEGLASFASADVHSAAENAAAARETAAVLSWVRNNVKSKRADAIAWNSADAGRDLFDRDAVQTLDRSAAEITFDENSVLDMGEKSLLIIKRMTHDPMFNEKRSFMVLVDGDLRGKLAAATGDNVYLEVGTPGAMVKAQSGPMAGGPVDFKISVNPDQTSTIAVYKGSAEVMAQGQKVIVGANQATVVPVGGTPIAPGALPSSVSLNSPRTGNVYVYRDLPPQVPFSWTGQQDVRDYHFVLARDPHYHDIVTDEIFDRKGFKHGNLQKGTYYWKVSAMAGSIEGFFSETRSFRVVQDRTPPTLQVRFPPDKLKSGRFILRGVTEPGARVYVDGARVKTTRTGKFETHLRLQPGLNVIVVEAFDGVDNVAYQTKRVISKY